jgi:hypothetical protein
VSVALAVLPDGVNEAGLKLHVAYAGSPEQLRLTDWLNPPIVEIATELVVELPLATEALVGVILTVKFGVSGGLTVTETALELDGLKFVSPS